MTPTEIQKRLSKLAADIGNKARVSLSVTHSNRHPVSAVLYTDFPNDPIIRVTSDEWADAVEKLERGWAEFQARHDHEMTQRMAVAIIRETDEIGECTDAALRCGQFSASDISKYGEAACQKANEMAGKGPFSIVRAADKVNAA